MFGNEKKKRAIMVVSRVWYLTRRPEGFPRKDDFTLKEEQLPPCGDGEVIAAAEYVSVDPYLRYRARQIELDTVMTGTAVCRVIESRNSEWPEGSYLVHNTGWRTHTLLKKESLESSSYFGGCFRLPDYHGLPRSLSLGALGMPGNTAYFGLLEICKPKEGETVLVNCAAGAVGSLVVQIAKLKGCKVIGFTGSDEKVSYLMEIGADHAFNYKTTPIGEALEKAAPEKINCYFDNVGGQFTAEALPHMADFCRIAVCGAISTYNDESKDIGKISMTSPYSEATILWKQLRIEGFIVVHWQDRWTEGIEQIKQWITEGKIKYRETITDGFDKVPDAFIGLFSGENIGKAVVKV